MDDATRCPCLSGETFGACCGPLLRGERPAPTAERLMRSRFTAFALHDDAWLLATWHPSTRPGDLELDPGTRWYRLDVLGTRAGGPFDDDGVVEFAAHHRSADGAGVLHEISRFVRERVPGDAGGPADRRWLYVDGDVG